MKDMGIVQGSLTQAQPLIIGVDTVYVHTNIVKLETDSMGNAVDNLYQYNEVQYGKNEYIGLQSKSISELSSIVADLTESVLMGVSK